MRSICLLGVQVAVEGKGWMVFAIDYYDYTGRQIKRRQNSKNKQTNKQTDNKKSKIRKFNSLTTTSRTDSIFALRERIQNNK